MHQLLQIRGVLCDGSDVALSFPFPGALLSDFERVYRERPMVGKKSIVSKYLADGRNKTVIKHY